MTHPGSVWHGEFSTDGRMILTETMREPLVSGMERPVFPLSGWVKNVGKP
jgi:hypothetical protein